MGGRIFAPRDMSDILRHIGIGGTRRLTRDVARIGCQIARRLALARKHGVFKRIHSHVVVNIKRRDSRLIGRGADANDGHAIIHLEVAQNLAEIRLFAANGDLVALDRALLLPNAQSAHTDIGDTVLGARIGATGDVYHYPVAQRDIFLVIHHRLHQVEHIMGARHRKGAIRGSHAGYHIAQTVESFREESQRRDFPAQHLAPLRFDAMQFQILPIGAVYMLVGMNVGQFGDAFERC